MNEIWSDGYICDGCLKARSARRKPNKYSAKREYFLPSLCRPVSADSFISRKRAKILCSIATLSGRSEQLCISTSMAETDETTIVRLRRIVDFWGLSSLVIWCRSLYRSDSL